MWNPPLGQLIVFRDHDLDGMPDEVGTQLVGIDPEVRFGKIENKSNSYAPLMQWAITIGVTTNYVLHDGKLSAMR